MALTKVDAQLVSGAITTDSSGNVGLGVTPSTWSLGKAFELNNAGNAVWGVAATEIDVSQNAYYNSGWKYAATNYASRYEQNTGAHKWWVAPSGTAGNAISFTQAMTLDSSGNLLVGTTSQLDSARASIKQSTSTTAFAVQVGANGNYVLASINAAGSVVGGVVANASSTSFPTSSDYRLKENIAPMQNALNVVQQLKPVTYTWKADGSSGQGFIAHELAEVVPDCVTGKKDAVKTVDDVDAEGKVIGTKEVPVYQGIDTSFLVATLTAAIQELKAELDATKAEVAALKGAA